MGKTRRYHGRENGEEAKFHRWWRINEGDVDRNDHDRIKMQQVAVQIASEEGVKMKSRKTKKPPARPTPKGYGFKIGQRTLDEWELERAGKTSRYNDLDWNLF